MTKSLPRNIENSCPDEALKKIHKKNGPLLKPNRIIVSQMRLLKDLKTYKEESNRRQLLYESAKLPVDPNEILLKQKLDDLESYINKDKQFYLNNAYFLSKKKN
jgi:hypothetical protein